MREGVGMESVEHVLSEVENKLCDKIITEVTKNKNFKTVAEMKAYNQGISDAMKIVRARITSGDNSNVFNA